ncbi:MAG: septum formation protein Maf [Deltaproteobacteria bacterium]|nr:MAG: septum formation protein Maf [Deltaproteobacteria bacterium]
MSVQIILASASPRRKELLERLGFTVKVIPSAIDEVRNEGEAPENFVKRMARTKCLAVVDRLNQTMYPAEPGGDPQARRYPAIAGATAGARTQETRWVIGADTVVVLGDRILGKPKDTAEASEMLHRLGGNSHRVITGFCIHDLRKNKEGIQAVGTDVRFKRLTSSEIEKYIAVGESMDKAGAYAVQGVGAYLIDSIVGSYTNVVGLPLCQTVEMMEEMGAHDILPY